MTTYKLIVFDMDGVIFQHRNFWLELHKRFGTYREGMALTKKYLKTDYERLVKEVPGRLWKGKDATPYFELVNEANYKPFAQTVLKDLRAKGLKTAIISSGPKHLALRVKNECGLDYYRTHDLVIEHNKISGEYVYTDHDDKTDQLKDFAQEASCTLAETVFVGHSHNDVTALRAAGLGVAYCPDDDEDVREAAKVIIEDLRELLDMFEA